MKRASPTTIGVIAGSVVGIVAVASALAAAWRDSTPPVVIVSVPDRAPAGEEVTIDVVAKEDATLTFGFDGGVVTLDALRDVEATVQIVPPSGATAWNLVARDGAGLETRTSGIIRGEPVPTGSLTVPASVRVGDPIAVHVDLRPIDAPVQNLALRVDDANVQVVGIGGRLYGLAAAPLTSDPSPITVHARWTDAFGRDHEAHARIDVVAREGDVEDLDVPAATLAVVNDAARAIEADALADAVADPTTPPKWTEPFLMPTEGFGSAGFASARRYAPGGPVSFHEGEDVAAPTGTSVRSTNDGTVLLARDLPIKGGTVIVDHGGGITSRYYHLSQIDVGEGERVIRGQRIGAVGSTGLSTGPHLHFEVRVGLAPTDALAWIGRRVPGDEGP